MQSPPLQGETQSRYRKSWWIVGGLFLLVLSVGAWLDLTPKIHAPVLRVDYTGPPPVGAAARLGRGAVNTLTVSPDARTVAVGGRVGVFVYDALTMEEIWAIPSPEPVISLAYSPDGALLAAGLQDGTLALLNAGDGFLLNAQGGGREVEVQSLSWSPDPVDPETGYLLAVGFNDGGMVLAGIRNDGGVLDFNLLGSFVRNQTGITAIAFSPNNRILATGNRGGEIYLWDAVAQELLLELDGHEEYHAIQDLQWSRDGSRLLSGGRDGRVILWDMLTFAPAREFVGHPGEVLAVHFGPAEGELASVDQDGVLIDWQDAAAQPQEQWTPANAGLTAAGWSPGGEIFVAVTDNARIVTWDFKDQPLMPEEGRVLIGHAAPSDSASAVAWSPNGRILATANGNAIFLWDVNTLHPKETLLRHQAQVTSLVWSPDGAILASGSRDKTIMIWDGVTGVHLRTLVGHANGISDLAWAPGGEYLASAGALELGIRLWDPEAWQVVGILQHPAVGYWSLDWSPDGATLATGHGSGSLFFWDFTDGVPAQSFMELEGHLSWVADVAYSPDGTLVASAGADTQVLLWELGENPTRQTLAGHRDVVRGVAFRPDGGVLASGAVDQQVFFWDLAGTSPAGPRPGVRIGHTADVRGLAWSPDGTLLASGSRDGTVILWEAEAVE